MKNLFKVFAIIALVAIIGFAFITCDDGNNNYNNNNGDDTRPGTPEAMSGKTALQYFTDEGIKIGINAGNSLDALDTWTNPSKPISIETAWGNPKLNQAYFNGLKTFGFDIVRVPVTWNGHIGSAPNYKIEEAYLARVAEVVGYAHTAGLKVFINIHHDGNHNGSGQNMGGWLDIRNAASDPTITAKFEAVWKQIAEYFINYGDYLMFQGFNEIHDGTWNEHGTSAQYAIINSWNQKFTDVVRATGGNNAQRYLLYYGYMVSHEIAETSALFQLPTDAATNRQIVGFHFYSPWSFAGAATDYNWSTEAADKANFDSTFGKMKTKFVNNGIPVIIGELGPAGYVNWSGNPGYNSANVATAHAKRLAYIDYMFGKARENGIVPFYWENGSYDAATAGEGDFTLINRNNGQAKNTNCAEVIQHMVTAINNATPPTGGDPDLSGTISISPNTGVTINTELTATYSGSETVSFQWKKDGGNVGTVSATNPNKYTPTEAGSYSVTVSATGYNPKASAIVDVTDPSLSTLSGTITISPASAVTGTELTATYSGSETVSFQWKKDGGNVGTASATNPNKYTPTEAGSYTVTISANGYNAKTSAIIDVTDPSLQTLSGNITISPNTGVTTNTELTATYSGSETVSFQWKKDGGNVGTASATNPNKYTPTEAGSYTVTVSATGYNPKTSAIVNVSDPSPQILSGNITISPNTGVTTNTELTATYSGSETVSFQWKKDGGNVGTASTTNPNKYTPTEAGSYTVTVSAAGYNPKTSTAVTVTPPALWVDPATQNTPLSGGTVLLSYSGGNKPLTGSSYGYETWDFSEGSGSTNTFKWYGANQGGGGAFRVEWNSYFLARLGYYWGNGGAYTTYNNIYVDYNFQRSANNTSPSGGFIGVYGWSRNPSASQDIEKLIEYYIVDDWFWDAQCGPGHIGGWDESANECEELGSFQVDGATYKIYKNPRINEPSIDGDKTFIQIFSVRQGRRTYGTISVTEHFKAWSKYITLGSMYEAKFKVEAFANWGTPVSGGYLDLRYLYLSQEVASRGGSTVGTTPVDYAGPVNPVTITNPSFTGWGGLGGETGNSFNMVKEATNTYDCRITYEFPTEASDFSQFTVSFAITKTADTGNPAKLIFSDRPIDSWSGDDPQPSFEEYRDDAVSYTHSIGNNQLTIAINKFDGSNPTADFTIVINSIRFHD